MFYIGFEMIVIVGFKLRQSWTRLLNNPGRGIHIYSGSDVAIIKFTGVLFSSPSIQKKTCLQFCCSYFFEQ